MGSDICLSLFLHHLGLLAYWLDKPSCYIYRLHTITGFLFLQLAKDFDKVFHALLLL